MERPPGCDLEQPRETWSIRCSYAIYLNFSKSGFQDRLVNSNIFEFFQVDYKTGLKQTVFIGNIIEFSQVNRKACSLLNLDKLYLLGIYLVFCKSISGHCKQKKQKNVWILLVSWVFLRLSYIVYIGYIFDFLEVSGEMSFTGLCIWFIYFTYNRCFQLSSAACSIQNKIEYRQGESSTCLMQLTHSKIPSTLTTKPPPRGTRSPLKSA